MTDGEFRALALALPRAVAGAHMGHPDFRVGGRIFATLGYPRRGWAMVKLTPDQQVLFVRTQPAAFAPASGAWGRAGSTVVRLGAAPKGAVQEALSLAWQNHAPERAAIQPAPRRVRRRAAAGPGARAAAGAAPPDSAETQVRGFIAKFAPAHQRLIRAIRRALRQRFRTAHELAYDNYNFFVLGYGPTARPSDCVVSLAAGANGVSLCFLHGARLPDPGKLLLGAGRQTRFLRLESADVLARPAVRALLAEAIARSGTPFPARGRVTLVVRSVSAQQRPRRRTPA